MAMATAMAGSPTEDWCKIPDERRHSRWDDFIGDAGGVVERIEGEEGELVCKNVVLKFPSMMIEKVGTLYMTNYKICFVYQHKNELTCKYTSIPNTYVQAAVLLGDSILSAGFSSWMGGGGMSTNVQPTGRVMEELGIEIRAKDFRKMKFYFRSTTERETAFKKINELCFFGYDKIEKVIPLHPDVEPPKYPRDSEAELWIYTPEREFERLGLNRDKFAGKFELSTLNENYQICETYPAKFILPKGVPREVVVESAKFRCSNRLPVITWAHPTTGATLSRCSQPQTGLSFARSECDEELVRRIFEAGVDASKPRPPMHIIDCRNLLTANANRIKGAGVENPKFYQCEITYMNISNIHAMRSSFKQLYELCTKDDAEIPDRAAFESTKWLEHIQMLIRACSYMANKILKGSSLLVHCSDGWDRTPQLTSLTQLLLDPYYRTIPGFCVLIQKEWLAFGHKFAHRIGLGLAENQSAEISPIFVQFMDAVHQLLWQFPNLFAFTEHFLIAILDHMYSCRFGTFLFNCEKERKFNLKEAHTSSLWLYLYSIIKQSRADGVNCLFINPNYRENNEVISSPIDSTAHLRIWDLYYQRFNRRFKQSHDHRLQPIPLKDNAEEMLIVRRLMELREMDPAQFEKLKQQLWSIPDKQRAKAEIKITAAGNIQISVPEGKANLCQYLIDDYIPGNHNISTSISHSDKLPYKVAQGVEPEHTNGIHCSSFSDSDVDMFVADSVILGEETYSNSKQFLLSMRLTRLLKVAGWLWDGLKNMYG